MNTNLCKTEAPSRESTKVQYRRPTYQSFERDGFWEVAVNVPGVSKEGVSLEYENEALTIQAGRTQDSEGYGKLLHREIDGGDYRLKLNLNVNIDTDAISATTEDGILTIRLPLKEEAKPRFINVE